MRLSSTFLSLLVLGGITIHSAAVSAQTLLGETAIYVPAQGGPLTPVKLTFDPTNPNRFAVVDVSDGSVGVWTFDEGFTKELEIDARAVAVAISPDASV
ncbi:MAG: hypothetical protein OES09_13895, partial [Gammaproteobacteria bacterium]|nr:hypothetical protein [Gammaproteobacteria bacterium]